MRPFVIAVSIIGSVACSASSAGVPAPAGPPAAPAAHPVFGDRVLRYDFTLATTHVDPFMDPSTAGRYLLARLSVAGEGIGTVGIRPVLEVGADPPAPCLDADAGCARRAFKVKFDLVDPDQRFHGLRRLTFTADPQDRSHLRERLALELFRRMALPAPRAALAQVTVNGVPRGVFTVVEEVDGAFVGEHWEDQGAGNLYKDAWPVATNPDEYTPALCTNLAIADNRLMAAFASALRAAGSNQALARTVAAFTDVEHLTRHLVVDQALNNREGIRAFHCPPDERCSNQNYFWYQIPGDDRLLSIPWQLSGTFELRTPLDELPAWNHPAGDCSPRSGAEGDVPVWPPGCDPLLRGLAAADGTVHAQAIDRLLQQWEVTSLRALLEGWQRDLAPVIAADPGGVPPIAWRAAVGRLGVLLVALRERLQTLRTGQAPPVFGLVVPGRTDLEDIRALGFHLGATSEANAASGEVLDLGREGSLGGRQDVRLEFELANDPPGASGTRAPYAQLRLPLAAGRVDLSGLRIVRLKLAADRVRAVRIEIDSPLYQASDPPNRYGRDFIVGKQPTELVLALAELTPADRGSPPSSALPEVLAAASALIVSPVARLADDKGLLPEGQAEPGYLRVDDIDIH